MHWIELEKSKLHIIRFKNNGKPSILQGNPAQVSLRGKECADVLVKVSGLGSAFHCPFGICKCGRQAPNFYNQCFIKPTIPELHCPRNLPSAVARLHAGHSKGMKISPDNSQSYPISGYIFDCKVILASIFKLYASPQDILYSPPAPNLVSLVIGTLEPI
ncbi:hypothetical protein TNCT_625571 [Trichonephila clavata]|uniref:Uncharacterized protein n=1 Tax=Trichonephila clavata TaxID=2740835 RepID=A0A8X6LRX1_TRICU|nr:hypothetical protein TNCT_625571 [Trichonephila clavata]